MKLGFYMGYAQPGTSPLELLGLAREAETPRLRLGLGRGGLGRGCDHATRMARRADVEPEARHGDHAAAGAVAGQRGDDRGDARPALGRPLPDGARHVRTPGRRGLARPGMGKAARQDPGVRRDRACDRPSRAARASWRALRHPGPGRHRAREAVEADGAPAEGGDPDLPGRDRAEGGRAGLRDRRRLAADLLVAGAGARRLSARPGT